MYNDDHIIFEVIDYWQEIPKFNNVDAKLLDVHNIFYCTVFY